MILIPDTDGNGVQAMGFFSEDQNVGEYFGSKIFAETPFEHAPVLPTTIHISTGGDEVSAEIETRSFSIKSVLSGLGKIALVSREPAVITPFVQQGGERKAAQVKVYINDKRLGFQILKIGISGGPGAVYSPFGSFSR